MFDLTPQRPSRLDHHWLGVIIILIVLAKLAFGQGVHDPKWTPPPFAPSEEERLPVVMIQMATGNTDNRYIVTEAEVLANLTTFEGYRLTPYNDGRTGAVSVGIGHNLVAHREPIKRRYTEAEVMTFFRQDLSVALSAARAGVRDFNGLPKPVQLVCLGLVWTTGPTGFQRFVNFRAALSYRAYDAAAAELKLSRWYYQVSSARVDWACRTLLSYSISGAPL